MLKRSVLLFIALVAFLASAGPALAYPAPVEVYVDTAYVGTETGTAEQPYNTIAEADAVAQTKAGGGVIMVKKDGVYVYDHFVRPVRPGQTGIPLAGPVLYALLALVCVVLIVAGWLFGHRSRQLQH